jgi:hypothetical protein
LILPLISEASTLVLSGIITLRPSSARVIAFFLSAESLTATVGAVLVVLSTVTELSSAVIETILASISLAKLSARSLFSILFLLARAPVGTVIFTTLLLGFYIVPLT